MTIEMTEVGPPLTDARIYTLEQDLGINLPADYRPFLIRYNGGRPKPECFPIRGLEGNPFGGVRIFFGLDKPNEASNLNWRYRMYFGRIPSNLLPIGGTDTGDMICLSLEGQDKGTIYFWDHESEHIPPSYNNVYFIAASFPDFLESIHIRDISAEIARAVAGGRVISKPN